MERKFINGGTLKSKSKSKKNERDWIDDNQFNTCDYVITEEDADKIANQFLAGKNRTDKPKAFITYGYPGSGKTTMAINFLGTNHKYAIVSVDEVLEHMKEFKEGINAKTINGKKIGSKNMFRKCISNAEIISNTIYEMGKNDDFDLLIDTPSPSAERAIELKQKNYKMTGLYVMRKWESIKRAIQNRAYDTGRFIEHLLKDDQYDFHIKYETYMIASIAKHFLDNFYICLNDPIKIPQWAIKYLTEVDWPKKQSWIFPAKLYKVSINNMTVDEITKLLTIGK
jgi:adenylate kinase family enzyme